MFVCVCVYVLTHTHTHTHTKPILFQLNKSKQTARLHSSLNTVDVCEYATFRHVRKAAKSIYQLRRACSSAWNNSVPTGRISVEF